MNIAQLGQPVLRRQANPVSPEEIASPAFQQFIKDMKQTLDEAGGVGLAAPQVHLSKRLFLACTNTREQLQQGTSPTIEVFINPNLLNPSEEQSAAWEGCLSFPELQVLVARPHSIRVEYLDGQGQARALDLEGFPARVVQHEHDHLEGILTLDRAVSTHHIFKTSEMSSVLG